MKNIYIAFILLLNLILANAAKSAVEYTVTDLGNYQGYSLQSLGMNDNGDVVGVYQVEGGRIPFLYHNGQVQSLGKMGGYDALAFAINNQGYIVGTRNSLNGGCAFLYHDGSATFLPTLGGTSAGARDINSRGDIVGSSYLAGDIIARAYLYRDGQLINIGTLGSHSHAEAINEQGVIAGYSYASDNKPHVFRYENNQMTDLGTLGNDTYTQDINNLSQIVGTANRHGFFYDGTKMIIMGSFDNRYSEAQAINDQGLIVGQSSVSVPSTYGTHAFLYKEMKMYDLNSLIDPTLGLELYQAVDINNEGQIVVQGTGFKSYLLTPIPEPATILSLLAAIPVLVICWAKSRAYNRRMISGQ